MASSELPMGQRPAMEGTGHLAQHQELRECGPVPYHTLGPTCPSRCVAVHPFVDVELKLRKGLHLPAITGLASGGADSEPRSPKAKPPAPPSELSEFPREPDGQETAGVLQAAGKTQRRWPGSNGADSPTGQPRSHPLCTDGDLELSESSGSIQAACRLELVEAGWRGAVGLMGHGSLFWGSQGLAGQLGCGVGWKRRGRCSGCWGRQCLGAGSLSVQLAEPRRLQTDAGWVSLKHLSAARPTGPGPTALLPFLPRKEGKETQNCVARAAKSQEYLCEIIPVFWKRLGSSEGSPGSKGLEVAGRRGRPRPGPAVGAPAASPRKVTARPGWQAARSCGSGAPPTTEAAPSDQPRRPSPET